MSDILNQVAGELPPLPAPHRAKTQSYTVEQVEEIRCAAYHAGRQSLSTSSSAFVTMANRLRKKRDAEIADLRAQLAQQGQGEPVAAQFKAAGETWEECSIDEEEVMLKHGFKFRYLYAAPACAQPANMADAYVGTREDLAIWKKRALEAEENLRGALRALGAENGPTHTGEPVLRAQPAQQVSDAPECSPETLAAFLAGCAPIEGVWFGEEHPKRPGKFWWRDFLPAFRGAAPPQAARVAVPDEWRKSMRDLVRVLRGVECGDDGQWKFIDNVCANAEELLAASPATVTAPAQPENLADRMVSVAIDTGNEEADFGKRIFAQLTGEVASDGATLIADEVSRNFAATVTAPAAPAEPFGMYVERDDGTTEFQRTGNAFKPTACGYKVWTLYDAAPATTGMVGQDAKDAARYRWLRDKSEPGICAFYLSVGKAFHKVVFKPETVDEAIDAQIAALAAQQAQASAKEGDQQ